MPDAAPGTEHSSEQNRQILTLRELVVTAVEGDRQHIGSVKWVGCQMVRDAVESKLGRQIGSRESEDRSSSDGLAEKLISE